MDETEVSEALASLEEKALARVTAVEKKFDDMATKFDSAVSELEKSLIFGGRKDDGAPKTSPEQKAALGARNPLRRIGNFERGNFQKVLFRRGDARQPRAAIFRTEYFAPSARGGVRRREN